MNILRKSTTNCANMSSCAKSIKKFALEHINRKTDRKAAWLINTKEIHKSHELWKEALPRVEPLYAVKCNPDQAILKTMVDLGMGFDCASQREIKAVLELGADPSSIVFANPYKHIEHCQYANDNHVTTTTYDSEDELYKIKESYSNARLLLRILPPLDKLPLGGKFGCHLEDAPNLLQKADKLDLQVDGVSFHLGGQWDKPEAFSFVIESARKVFDMANQLGLKMNMLNIGGGFPANNYIDSSGNNGFKEIAKAINKALDVHFAGDSVNVVAEPGRFYVATTSTLLTNVIGRRLSIGTQEEKNTYFISDSVWGSFNPAIVGEKIPDPVPLTNYMADQNRIGKQTPSLIYGQSSDGSDKIMSCFLPELAIGDWIVFNTMGAYTYCLSTDFNGLEKADKHYI